MPLSFRAADHADSVSERKTAKSVSKFLGGSILSDFASVCRNRRATLEDVEARVDGLFAFCARNGDWSPVDPILRGTVEYSDPFAGTFEERAGTVAVPDWISGYVRLRLARKDAFGSYYRDRSKAANLDDVAISVLERVSEFPWGKSIRRSLRKGLVIRLLSEASGYLENSLRDVYPEVTKNPAFPLLLLNYEALHATGVRPEAFHEDADSDETYFDNVQSLMEIFPKESNPELYLTLREFRFGSAEHDLLSDITSHIEYEGEMERIRLRGNERQKIVDGLMARIRGDAGEVLGKPGN